MENGLQHSTCEEPTRLTYDLIKEITNGLDKDRIVGSGAFGTVYRGVYKNGDEIAVKILRNLSGFDCKEFLKEFGNLRGLKHQNVVELVGFCNESKEVVAEYEGKQVLATQIHTVLCFEYVKNGSLQKHISDESMGLNWPTRYEIIKGICQGLKYLREGLKSPIMHLDLKPDNILLDQEMVPKIADFGLSRLFGEENTIKTISSVGTLGYLPPEYIELQVISETYDIFSLGVIITKIITGHEGYNSIADMAPTKFVKQIHDKWRKRLVKNLNPRPLEVYCHQVKICIEIALECIKRNRRDRPTIQHIVSTLLGTEIMIQNLGLQADQFPNGESIDAGRYVPERQLPARAKNKPSLPKRNIAERPPVVASLSAHPKHERLARDHRVDTHLCYDLFAPYAAARDCIIQCIGASSTDNFPAETVENTIKLVDSSSWEMRPSYWSSRGQKDPTVPECLIYRLQADLCLVDEIKVQPFKAFYQYGAPIYSAKSIRFQMGYPRSPLRPETLVSDENEGQLIDDCYYVWTYTSPEFPMLQKNDLQSFKLPHPVLCLGGVVKVELLGRVQKQALDDLYYICVSHVQIVWKPLLWDLGVAPPGKVMPTHSTAFSTFLDLWKKMTNDFSDERKLGEDAFGPFYMGNLDDGRVITVKRLAETSPVAHDKAFTAEIQNTMALHHKNIVRLHGYSHEVQKKVVQNNGRYIVADVAEFVLCYEYLPKGTLQEILFEVPSRMDWDTRFKIIKGICNGLSFLHRIPMVHMDLNPETIFLDDDMNPKIASFYLSKVFGREQTRMFTQNVVGSQAYMSPEYVYRGEISTQSDIYTLGLVIIEIITGQKNSPRVNDLSSRQFIEKVRQDWTIGHIASVYHSSSADCLTQVKKYLDLGLACVQADRRVRPSADDILDMINGHRTISPVVSDSLFEQPQELRFLLEPKRLTSRSLCLTNSTGKRIAFRLVTETPRMYLTKLPLCGIVPPYCTYTLCVTMREHEKAPPSNGNNFLILQTRGVHGYVDNPDSMTEFIDRAGDDVQEVKVTVSYELPVRRSIFKWTQKKQSIQQGIEIIDGQNYRQALSIDMHSTEPWILMSNQRGYACIWNYQTQEEVYCFEVSREDPVYSAKFVEREKWLVVGGGDGNIYVYRYDTMKEVTSVGAHGGRRPVTSLAVHPTYSLVLSASDDDLIKLWDWDNDWQCTRTFEWHSNRVTQLMFDPNDSKSFASTSLEGTVKIWNTSSGMCIITLDGLHCLHYVTGDNRPLLISGSSDGSAKVWDLETDNCVNTLNGHTDHLNALWWHPELEVLITGSADGIVQIWKFTDNTFRLENIIDFNLGSVNDLGYVKKRIVVGCDQGVVMMEINLPEELGSMSGGGSDLESSKWSESEEFMYEKLTSYTKVLEYIFSTESIY